MGKRKSSSFPFAKRKKIFKTPKVSSSKKKNVFNPPKTQKQMSVWSQLIVLSLLVLVIYAVISNNQTGIVQDDATATPTFTATLTSIPPTVTLTRTPRPTSTPVTCPNINATCSQLTCAEARACLAAGNQSLDGDDDGQPCESKCR